MKTKPFLQKLLRDVNIKLSQKDIPKKICLSFNDINENDIRNIKSIIAYFKFLGFNFCTVNYLDDNLDSSKKLIALSFNEGYSSWLNLNEYFTDENIRATFYLNTIYLKPEESLDRFYRNINFNKKTKIISKSEINKLILNNHEIGAHGHSHVALSKMNFFEFLNDVNQNINILKESFDVDINSFAIPFGIRRHIKKEQLVYLNDNFKTVAFLEPGMLFNHKKGLIQRYPWKSEESFLFNLDNICSNTSLFNKVTKRSGLG